MNNARIRRTILQNAFKLKNFRTETNKKVFITPDMTKQQQAANKKLNDELYALRRQGKSVKIKNGKIISTSSRKPDNSNSE